MIGGNDIVIPAVGDAAALEACVRILRRHWPQVRFEDAVSGEKYSRDTEMPLGRNRELLAYPDSEAEDLWDSDSPNSPPNSMLYLILSENSITAVLGDPNAADMRVVLDSRFDTRIDADGSP